VADLVLVRPKRLLRLLFVSVLACLASCATVHVDGHDVFGRVHDVSDADIRAALAAEQRESSWVDKTIYHIEVVSRDEMRLFHQPSRANRSHDVLKRVKGQWHVVDTHVIVGGGYFQ
jgi:hypothetical protein